MGVTSAWRGHGMAWHGMAWNGCYNAVCAAVVVTTPRKVFGGVFLSPWTGGSHISLLHIFGGGAMHDEEDTPLLYLVCDSFFFGLLWEADLGGVSFLF